MKKIDIFDITNAVSKLCILANLEIGDDVLTALSFALSKEESEIGRGVLSSIIENSKIAKVEQLPLCQDTGLAVVFIEIGQNVCIVGGSLKDAINEGVRRGYEDGYLRKSCCNVFTRKNTGDNTPAFIHYEIVEGDDLKITLAPKGGGSENMSRVTMLPPSAGIKGVKDFVVQRVSESGANPCPPIIVGIGLGGTFEYAGLLAKKALLRKVGEPSSDSDCAKLEVELLEEINRLGIGPAGLGGRITCLAVHVNATCSHIASIPVAVNIQCHSARHKHVIL